MNEDYLWDRSGEADEEMQQLEQLLSQFRYGGRKKRAKLRWLPAIAASVCATVGIGLYSHFSTSLGAITDWTLTLEGRQPAPVRAGQVIETDGRTQATLEAGQVGRVQIEPASRFRLEKAGRSEQRFLLDHGTIHAFIWAPPTQFVVDTLSAKTVDLGCQYTLRIAPDGSGALTVETGWVAFEWQHTESFIPAGARCLTQPHRGPGTPYFLDATGAFIEALGDFDRAHGSAALEATLAAARKRDALTLWHLLLRTKDEQRGRVFYRLSTLVALPGTVTREAILNGKPQALDAAWNALDLGNTSWWREWKQPWSGGF